jgi:dienelactone hydrolase
MSNSKKIKRMRKFTILSSFLFLSIYAFGQFQLGHRVITFKDPARNNRSVETHLYYPANTAGDNVPIANGTFPVVVMGHGFIMGNPALYGYLWQEIATKGYIMAFPTTENGSVLPPPNHLAFGQDLAFLVDTILGSNNVSSSFLFGKVTNKAAIMGHSMGGKSAHIGAKLTTKATTLISMGGSIANPPIGTSVDVLGDYARHITIPTVVVAGEFDCVAPPAENQKLLYDTTIAACKYYVTIKGGGHCYFASQAGSGLMSCESGENSSCTANFTITREQQNQYLVSFLLPWLNYQLKNNAADGLAFRALVTTSNLYTTALNCPLNTTGIENLTSSSINIFPNPASGSFNIQTPNAENISINIKSITGANVFSNIFETNNITIQTENFSKGLYFVEIIINNQKVVKKIIID